MNARRASDWAGAPRPQAGEERSGAERRANDRRAPRRALDPLFAATLINQIAPPQTEFTRGYTLAPPPVRRGFIVNARA